MGSVIYSSGSLPSNDAENILFASGVAKAYSGTILASNSNVAPFITALSSTPVNTGALLSLGQGATRNYLGGSASVSYTPPPVTPTYSCTGTLVTANANITNTTGLSVDTAYQTTTSGNACYYTCKPNYSGTNCQTYTAPLVCGSATSCYTITAYTTASATGATITTDI